VLRTLERGGFVAKIFFLPGAEKMPFEFENQADIFATNSPQGETDRKRQWRISAGYRGAVFCGKMAPKGLFLFVTFI